MALAPSLKFKDIFDSKERRNRFQQIQKKYPNLSANIPIIFQSSTKSKLYKHVPYTTFHIHSKFPVSVVRTRIMKKLQVKSDQSFNLLIGKHLLTPSKQIGQIYNLFKQDDGFLYITFIQDNPF